MQTFIVLLVGVVAATHGWNSFDDESPQVKREVLANYNALASAYQRLSERQHQKRAVNNDFHAPAVADNHEKRSISHGHNAPAVQQQKRSAFDEHDMRIVRAAVEHQKRSVMEHFNNPYVVRAQQAKRAASMAPVAKHEKRSVVHHYNAPAQQHEKRSVVHGYNAPAVQQEKRSVLPAQKFPVNAEQAKRSVPDDHENIHAAVEHQKRSIMEHFNNPYVVRAQQAKRSAAYGSNAAPVVKHDKRSAYQSYVGPAEYHVKRSAVSKVQHPAFAQQEKRSVYEGYNSAGLEKRHAAAGEVVRSEEKRAAPVAGCFGTDCG